MASASEPATSPGGRHPFRDVALASGLITADQLQAAEAFVRGAGVAAAPAVEWDRAVAARLVDLGALTPFQSREILAGRTRFRLGQYTVLDEIGRGGMGQVFRAEHAMMGREVAVKVLPRTKATPEYEAAFRREIRILARLDHENLVRALDAGHDANVYYLVTELVPGLDLRRQVLKYGPLDVMTAASVIVQAARGLAYAHEQRLVHRDVKPGNVLVTPDGRVKVLDLGLAGSAIEGEATRSGRIVGTMDYIAPEQIRAPDDAGPAADVYSLGCTLYFILAGRVPFPGGSRKEKLHRHLHEAPVPLHEAAPQVGRELSSVVDAMMRKTVAERIGGVGEVIDRLRPWTPPGPVPMPRKAGSVEGGRVGRSGSSSIGEPSFPAILSPGEVSRTDAETSRGHAWSIAPADGAWDPWLAWGQRVCGSPTFRRIAFAVGSMILKAALMAVAFAWMVGAVRGMAVERFTEVMGDTTPAGLGWAAFFVVLAAMGVASLGKPARH